MKKEIYLPYFENTKATVMGLGLLGRGVGDTAFLAKLGTELLVTDKKTKEQLASSLQTLERYNNITYRLGEHTLEDFENRDFILKAAGVPFDSVYIKHAKDKGIPVYMSAALVSFILMQELPDVIIIGVTGTRGKSTTTELIAHILRENGMRVHLGGNIRGVANLPLLEDINDGDYLVLELDSWQLQGFGDMKISPQIAVFTSFMDDHMNYYDNDREHYFNDKANIYRFQNEYDILLASKDTKQEILKRDKKARVHVPDAITLETSLIGEHNQVAAQLAYEACSQCGLDDNGIRAAIKTFKAVHGRLEDLGLYNGVRVFNDNNATTPDATIKAIEAITKTYNLTPIVITGGTDKGLPLAALEKVLQEKTKAVIYLSGTGTDRLMLSKEYEYPTMSTCVSQAFKCAKKGDVIIFSPAFASFSKYFNNEYERNDAFIKELEKHR